MAGPASRPLPLFYALSQAGRAIASAHASDDDWQLHGHGLTTDLTDSVLECRVKAQGGGSFGVVSVITGSAPLEEPVELGALWASLPDLADTVLPENTKWHQPLFVWPRDREDLLVHRAITAIKVAVVFGWDAKDGSVFIDKLASYPTATGATLDSPPGLPLTIETPRGQGLLLSWSGYDEHGSLVRQLDDVAPQYRFHRERWLRPTIGSADASLSPLMTWWALLYGFSVLARYEPSTWVSALDLDSSPLAVHIADALDEALAAVPHLVLEALLRARLPLWRLPASQ